MNRFRKSLEEVFLAVFVIVIVSSIVYGKSAFAQETQNISLTTNDVLNVGESFVVDVSYSANGGSKTTGIDISIFFDPDKVEYTDYSDNDSVFQGIGNQPPDSSDEDGDSNTTKKIICQWADTSSIEANWPTDYAGGSKVIIKINFKLLQKDTYIRVKININPVYEVGEEKALYIAPAVKPQYEITASATPANDGTITPSWKVLVTEGANKTFTIQANQGYEIDKVIVDYYLTAMNLTGMFLYDNLLLKCWGGGGWHV